MDNEAYRQSRGTDKPFCATEEQVRRAWFKINRTQILARREREKLKATHKRHKPVVDLPVESEE